jgi:K+-sensing histidine kinase KdpD
MPLDEEEIQQALDGFMTAGSHEVRTPIAIIMGYSQLALEGKQGPLSEEQRKIFSVIYKESVRLRESFESFLWRIRLNVFNNQIHLSIEKVNLNQFIPQIIAATKDRWLMQQDPSIIEQRIPDKLPHIWVDREWVQKAVIIVLSEITKEEAKILLAVTHNDISVKLNISTLGDYSNFYEWSLPLLLAQAIIEQHNGQMEVIKTDTQLEFILTLPISKNRPVSS